MNKRAIYIGNNHYALNYGMTGDMFESETVFEQWFRSDSDSQWYFIDAVDIYIPNYE